MKLKDIAARTGYSINTVSHALHNKSDIAEETRKYIQQVAEEMGYIGNAMASSLRSGSTKTVAIVLGDISNPHFAILVKEMESRLHRLGYISIILNTDERERQERQALIAALQKNVDGIILCPAPGKGGNVAFLQEQHTPFALIGRRLEGFAGSYVICDDENSGYMATQHLLELGHRRILFLNGSAQISSARERLAGYRRALSDHGLPWDEELVEEIPITMEGERSRIDSVLTRKQGYTAVLAFSDMIAWEVVYHLERRGRRVPEDVAVMGFDNIQSKYRFPVPLSTVSSSKTTMSRVAVDLLMDQIQTPAAPPCQRILETKLRIRRSTVKANA